MPLKFFRPILAPAAVFLGGGLLFVLTLAPGTVFGDPAEYTLMPHLWAVVHPPGYALMTLLVKAWQTLVPVGSLAYRTNLLAAAAGAASGALVFEAVRRLSPRRGPSALAALFAALSLYAASDFWQHSIHANAHVVTAVLAALAIVLLLQWRAASDDRWLYAFGWVAGLSVTHHPLLVLGFPAFALFVLANRPRWRSLGAMAGFGLLGLLPWLYFPIRASIQPPPPFGPHDMNTVDGFLNLVLARGLSGVNLFHFGWGDQWHRLVVFWSLLRLQFAPPVIILAGLGLLWLARRDWRAAALLGLHALLNLAFTLNSVQDVMAYLLVPLVSIAVCAGAGAVALSRMPWFSSGWRRWLPAGLLLFPLANIAWLGPRISLRDQRAADDYVDAVFAHFGGRGRQAVLLSDWEHATPLWYREMADGQRLDPADVTVVYVNKPWMDAVWENIDKGPVYLVEYNPEVVNTGFRLRAEGPFFRLVAPPATDLPPIAHRLALAAGPLDWLGYDVLTGTVRPGGVVPIILYLRAPAATDRIVHPFARLGPWEHRFTTDSHLLTPSWQAGEIMAERWEVVVPLTAPAGDYPLSVGLSDLSAGEDLRSPVELGTVRVTASWPPGGPPLRAAGAPVPAANFGQRVGVQGVQAWAGGRAPRNAPWAEPMEVRPGETVEIRIRWRALARPENSYTVFVHLLDSWNGLVTSRDYTPLGGAFPTMLWFPKWLPGQTAVDPYALTVPPDAPPGDYFIEIGLYGLRSVVRVPAFDEAGNLVGDRFVLGGVRVQP